MTDEPPLPGVATGRRCIAAIRSLLATFPQTDAPPGGGDGGVDVWGFVQDADPLTVYQLVSLSAATIRWASVELGRPESEILDELAANFERGSTT